MQELENRDELILIHNHLNHLEKNIYKNSFICLQGRTSVIGHIKYGSWLPYIDINSEHKHRTGIEVKSCILAQTKMTNTTSNTKRIESILLIKWNCSCLCQYYVKVVISIQISELGADEKIMWSFLANDWYNFP